MKSIDLEKIPDHLMSGLIGEATQLQARAMELIAEKLEARSRGDDNRLEEIKSEYEAIKQRVDEISEEVKATRIFLSSRDKNKNESSS